MEEKMNSNVNNSKIPSQSTPIVIDKSIELKVSNSTTDTNINDKKKKKSRNAKRNKESGLKESNEDGTITEKKVRQPPVPRKKMTKLVIRKLPSVGFTSQDFEEHIYRTCEHELINIDKSKIEIQHFIIGKISRKKGPVSGTGFVCFDEDIVSKFINNCPNIVPFLLGDELNSQPVIQLAPYQKQYRTKEKRDKLCNTYENDPIYLQFIEKINKPEPKRQSAEVIYDINEKKALITKAEELKEAKNVPLLKFLKDRAMRKIAEKRALRKNLSKEKDRKGNGSKDKVVALLSRKGDKNKGPFNKNNTDIIEVNQSKFKSIMKPAGLSSSSPLSNSVRPIIKKQIPVQQQQQQQLDDQPKEKTKKEKDKEKQREKEKQKKRLKAAEKAALNNNNGGSIEINNNPIYSHSNSGGRDAGGRGNNEGRGGGSKASGEFKILQKYNDNMMN
jgi:hypothetical protein